jgi:hypothetical protein
VERQQLLQALRRVTRGCDPSPYTSQDLVSGLPLEGTWAASDGVWQIKKQKTGARDASKSDLEAGFAGHLACRIRMQGGEGRRIVLAASTSELP